MRTARGGPGRGVTEHRDADRVRGGVRGHPVEARAVIADSGLKLETASVRRLADGRFAVTYNGELYNYRELRRELAARGVPLRTSCDTEVLVHLYEEHGPELVRHLRAARGLARKCLVLDLDDTLWGGAGDDRLNDGAGSGKVWGVDADGQLVDQ